MTLSEARLEQKRAAGAKGGRARAWQFTSDSQKAARANVRRDSLVASGQAGGRATLAIYGRDQVNERLARWRRKHPTALERIVMAWLDEWGETYQREVYVAGYYVDFLLPFHIAVEADGEHWHESNDHHGQDRPSLDAGRDRKIVAAGFTLIRLSEQSLLDGSAKEYLRQRIDIFSAIPF